MATHTAADKKEDLTGQSRFAWNLMVSWLSQLVLIFSGFVMPRLVDDRIGQAALGIWDFGWAFVGYLTLVGFGMGASFNRYIAKHRAAGEIALLNKVANSVIFVQLIIATIVALSTVIFYLLLPTYFADSLNGMDAQAQLVILFLGASLAIQMVSGSARGLLTGYHRWDIHNGLHAASSFGGLLLMLVSLFFTSLGVVGMAISYFIATLTFESLRFVFVRKICIEFNFNLRLARLATCKEMLTFGIKSMLSNLPPILLLQTINIMIVSLVGPAALAIFARPLALTRHINVFMNKFTLMIAPTTGAMAAGDDLKDIRELYINTTKLSFAFSLPALAWLFAYGDTLLFYWMGPDYALWPLMMILAAGQLLPFSQDSSIRILMGLNQHGRVSILAFAAVLICFVILIAIVGIDNWELTTAALFFVLPLTLVYGFFVPIYTCAKLSLNYATYLYNTLCKTVLYALPYFALLALSKTAFCYAYFAVAAATFMLAILVTLIIYFKVLLSPEHQSKVLVKLGIKHSFRGLTGERDAC